MKQIKLRLEVTAENAAQIVDVQEGLLILLNKLGTVHLPVTSEEGEGQEDLAGEIKGPRVFWETVEVLQGAERDSSSNVQPLARRRVAKVP
jgi:hypothetical protein